MAAFQSLMKRLGYVKLSRYGLLLTPDDRVISISDEPAWDPPQMRLPVAARPSTRPPMPMRMPSAPVAPAPAVEEDDWEWEMAMARAAVEAQEPVVVPRTVARTIARSQLAPRPVAAASSEPLGPPLTFDFDYEEDSGTDPVIELVRKQPILPIARIPVKQAPVRAPTTLPAELPVQVPSAPRPAARFEPVMRPAAAHGADRTTRTFAAPPPPEDRTKPDLLILPRAAAR